MRIFILEKVEGGVGRLKELKELKRLKKGLKCLGV
jgi:hypothetical protein